jgi:ActR/RegA family two-component response regulator
VKAPTRALIVEDIDTWAYTLDRAARRAGASEVVVCESLPMVREALRKARFDVAILDVGLDPDNDLNSDGVKALEAIRDIDGLTTRCVLVTGWQGDRMDLQADVHQKFGIDWAYMKERYEAHAVIAKLTELLEKAPARRLSLATPMANLCANVEPFLFEDKLVNALRPDGGMQTLYGLVSQLLTSAIPIVAMHPEAPMKKGADGVWTGLYWSRALASAVAVKLAPAEVWEHDEGSVPSDLIRLVQGDVAPDLIEDVQELNSHGRLWELPGLARDKFPG